MIFMNAGTAKQLIQAAAEVLTESREPIGTGTGRIQVGRVDDSEASVSAVKVVQSHPFSSDSDFLRQRITDVSPCETVAAEKTPTAPW